MCVLFIELVHVKHCRATGNYAQRKFCSNASTRKAISPITQPQRVYVSRGSIVFATLRLKPKLYTFCSVLCELGQAHLVCPSFKLLSSVTLNGLPEWEPGEHVQSPYPRCSLQQPVWTGILSNLSIACTKLMLKRYSPAPYHLAHPFDHAMTQALSHLTNLRHLSVQAGTALDGQLYCEIHLFPPETVAGLSCLEVLELSAMCGTGAGSFSFHRILPAQPASITRLQLHGAQPAGSPDDAVNKLTQLQSLRDLQIRHTSAQFTSPHAPAHHSLLTRLILYSSSIFLDSHNSILSLSALSRLSLRNSHILSHDPSSDGFMSALLYSLPCLQQFDVIKCPSITISVADWAHMKLASFFFEYCQLINPEASSFGILSCASNKQDH